MIAAIVPACGASRRMGQPKLILPIGGTPQIQRVIHGLIVGGASRVITVVPPHTQAGAAELAQLAAEAGSQILIADPAPTHMRGSVELGLRELQALGKQKYEAVLLTPGDALGVSARLVHELIDRFRGDDLDLVIATHKGRWGHPVMLRWGLAEQIERIPAELGINALVKRPGWRVAEVDSENQAVIADLDTPDDLDRWRQVVSADDAPGSG